MTTARATQASLPTVFASVDAQRDTALARLLAYLRQPSISAQGIGMHEAAELALAEMDALGLQPRRLPTGGWDMLFGERHDVPGAPTVLLYGHYDVQPPEPLELWHAPPFEPTIRDGRIYARGVADNKGQHFAQLLALEALLAAGGLPCNVMVLLEGEEEMGSPTMPAFVAEHAALLSQADVVIISDGGVHPSGQSTMVLGVRGIISFELRAQGANQDLHSGNWGGVAPNPLWTLVHLLGTMKNAQGELTIAGINEQVQPPTPRERDLLAALPIDVAAVQRSLDLPHLDAPRARPFYERLVSYPTLTINGLYGGYTGQGTKTVLPAQAVAKCDMRLVPNQTTAGAFAAVEAHVQQHAPDVTVHLLGGMDPSRTPVDSPYVAPIRQAILAAQGTEPLLIPSLGGSLPNYAFTETLGLPTFVVPYGNPDQANHAPNENMELERFFAGIKTGAAMLAHIAAMPPAEGYS